MQKLVQKHVFYSARRPLLLVTFCPSLIYAVQYVRIQSPQPHRGSMKYVLNTFRRTPSNDQATALGTTHLTLRKKELALMAKLENRLCRLNQSELAVDINPDDIQMEAPSDCGRLKDCRLQLVLNLETLSSSFHFAARQASDNSVVFTGSAPTPKPAKTGKQQGTSRLGLGGLISAVGA